MRQQYKDGSTLDARSSLYEWQEPRHDLVATVVAQLRPGDGPVVDVGCGRGQYLAAVRAAGFDAVGLDLSRGMQPTLVGDAARLPLPDDSAGAALAPAHAVPPAGSGRRPARARSHHPTRAARSSCSTNGLDHLQPYRDLVSEAAGLDDA